MCVCVWSVPVWAHVGGLQPLNINNMGAGMQDCSRDNDMWQQSSLAIGCLGCERALIGYLEREDPNPLQDNNKERRRRRERRRRLNTENLHLIDINSTADDTIHNLLIKRHKEILHI